MNVTMDDITKELRRILLQSRNEYKRKERERIGRIEEDKTKQVKLKC